MSSEEYFHASHTKKKQSNQFKNRGFIWKLSRKPANYMSKRKCRVEDLQSTWRAGDNDFLKLSTKSFVSGNTKHV